MSMRARAPDSPVAYINEPCTTLAPTGGAMKNNMWCANVGNVLSCTCRAVAIAKCFFSLRRYRFYCKCKQYKVKFLQEYFLKSIT